MKTLLLLGSLISTVCLAAPSHIQHVRGYTLDNQGQLLRFSNMVFDGGKVLDIGGAELTSRYPQATLINGHNQVLLPGLIDAHGHVMGLGESLLEVDLRDVGSAQLAAQLVRDYAQKHEELEWITGGGWNQVLWPDKQFPSAQQLDEYIQDRPVVLSRVDGHASWVNSKALSMAGIDKGTIDPPGGKIIRDAKGHPTGVLVDNAMDLVSGLIPKTSDAALKNKLDAAGQHLLSVGITSVHDAGVSKTDYDYYLKRQAEYSLPLRIYGMLWAHDPAFNNMLERGIVQDQYDLLSIRSVKAMADGALGSRGAALLAPYSDAPDNSGLLTLRESDYQPLFDLVLGKGFQLNVHAIGDRANRLVLNQFDDSFTRLGGKKLRNRMEHAQVVDLDDIARFKALNIIPSMQPTHATSDKNMAEDRIGKARLAGAYAWHTFLAQGSPLAFGSDFPVELANPFYGLHAAVTRQDRANQPVNGWIPEEALTIEQAFRAFTLDAAYAAHQETILGGLTPGKWADFILIDVDIFTVKPQDIWKASVKQTWLAGELRYQQ